MHVHEDRRYEKKGDHLLLCHVDTTSNVIFAASILTHDRSKVRLFFSDVDYVVNNVAELKLVIYGLVLDFRVDHTQ